MKSIYLGALLSFLVCTAGVVLCGCETESASQAEVVVSPGTAEVSDGESVTLTASGWEDYKWTLSDEKLGILSRRTGDSVVYTSITDQTNVYQTVTVFGDAGFQRADRDTNTTSTASASAYVVQGTAVIRHR